MADKKPAPPAATPAPAAASSAAVNPARAAVAEAKLDMSLDDILKKKRAEGPKKKTTKKSVVSKPTKKLDPAAKQKLGSIVKQTSQRAKAADRRKLTLASVKAKTIGRTAAGKARSVGGRTSSITDDLSKRIRIPLASGARKATGTGGQLKKKLSDARDVPLYRPPKAIAVSSPLPKGASLKIVIPPARNEGSLAARTPPKKAPSRPAPGGGVLGSLRAAATAAVHQRQQHAREEQLNAKRRIIMPGQQVHAEAPAAASAPKTLNDRFSQLSSSGSSTPKLRFSASSQRSSSPPVSAPRFKVTLQGASAPNPKIGNRPQRGGGGGGVRVGRGGGGRDVVGSARQSNGAASLKNRLHSGLGGGSFSRGGARGGRGRGGKFFSRR